MAFSFLSVVVFYLIFGAPMRLVMLVWCVFVGGTCVFCGYVLVVLFVLDVSVCLGILVCVGFLYVFEWLWRY